MALLIEAIFTGESSERIKKLIENGAAVNIPSIFYPLDAAVETNNARIVRTILKHVDYDINKGINGSDNNLLHLACKSASPRVGIVRGLLKHGINVNHVDQGKTPLHHACRTGNKSVVQLLIDYGADVNYNQEDKETPLIYAIFHKHPHIVDLLLQNGAEVYTMVLCYSFFDEALGTKAETLLIRHAANLNSQTIYNWTELSSAILDKKYDLVKQLFERKHEIDMLCLYAAVVCDSEEILELIWNNIAPERVSNDLNFMIYVFETLKNGELAKCRLFLNREDVDLHLERCGRAFAFFMCRIDIFENATRNDYYEFIKWLVRRGLRLARSDADIIINILPDPETISPLITQDIIDVALPKISLQAFVDSIQSKLDQYLIQYCLEANSTLYSNDIFLSNVYSWQYYFGLFTVPHVNKNNVIDEVKLRHRAEELECRSKLDQMNTKSLKELSRDTVREWLSNVCTDSRHMLSILDSLKLPRYIRNIIQCKEPVNLYVYTSN